MNRSVNDNVDDDGQGAHSDQSRPNSSSTAEGTGGPSVSGNNATRSLAERLNEISARTLGINNSSNSSNDEDRRESRPEESLRRARDILQNILLRRTRRFSSPAAAGLESSPDTSLEQGLQRQAERRERSRQRRSRRRMRDSSSENEESTARRRRRAHNVVSSLQEILIVPTSSTLGESTEGGTPRSNTNASTETTSTARPSENQNNESVNDSRSERREGISGMDTRSNINIFRRGTEQGNGREARSGNDVDDESDDDSINVMDDLIANGIGFELGPLVDRGDRERILNNLMQRSITLLRDIEGGSLGTQKKTDLKCPVCNEVFVDYEASDHPNAPGNRSGSIRCSHGALTLFTKLHQCPVCLEENIDPPNVVALSCGHVLCKEDFCKIGGHIGDNRPAGCPRAKPLPERSPSRTSRADNDNSSSNNNSSTIFQTFSLL